MEQFIQVVSSGLNVRSGPSSSFTAVGYVTRGTILEVIGQEGWYKVKLANGVTGYCSNGSSYVTPFTPDWLKKAQELIAYGETYLGTPYVFGSSRSDDSSFDCSDFVQWVYERFGGINMPGDSRAQSITGEIVPVSYDTLRSGDLLFFDTNGDGTVNHVAIYVHDQKILHTNSPTADQLDCNLQLIKDNGGGVTYASFSPTSYWMRKVTGARRVIL
jgi:cell wall-associated NlpC family hydrolase